MAFDKFLIRSKDIILAVGAILALFYGGFKHIYRMETVEKTAMVLAETVTKNIQEIKDIRADQDVNWEILKRELRGINKKIGRESADDLIQGVRPRREP